MSFFPDENNILLKIGQKELGISASSFLRVRVIFALTSLPEKSILNIEAGAVDII